MSRNLTLMQSLAVLAAIITTVLNGILIPRANKAFDQLEQVRIEIELAKREVASIQRGISVIDRYTIEIELIKHDVNTLKALVDRAVLTFPDPRKSTRGPGWTGYWSAPRQESLLYDPLVHGHTTNMTGNSNDVLRSNGPQPPPLP